MIHGQPIFFFASFFYTLGINCIFATSLFPIKVFKGLRILNGGGLTSEKTQKFLNENMKKLTTLTLICLCATFLYAQAPEKFTYQAVVRNTNNQLVTNTLVGVRISILYNSATGSVVYTETQTTSTNANGLVTLNIGDGSVVYGNFNGIDWKSGTFFLKSEIDPSGGSSYSITFTQQLMSVPYALYANEAGNGFSGDYNDLTNRPQIPQAVSELTNDLNFINLAQIPAQVNADWEATTGIAEILNKPAIPTVPTDISSFNNDAGYITADQLNTLLAAMNGRMDSLQMLLTSQDEVIVSLSNIVVNLGSFADSLGNIVDECGCLSTFRCGTSTITDYDGNAYGTVKLGGQCWMAENLRTRHYSNGDPIELGSFSSTTIPYRYYPAGDSANVVTYGHLYNWAALMNGDTSSEANPSGVQGICPTGWHVPSDAEWTELETFVSGQSQYVCNHQNTSNIGKALASATGWSNSTTTACGVGTTQSTNNATGFNARPAGNFYASGGNGFGCYANFWTTTKTTGGNAYYYNLSYTSPSLNRSNSGGASGFSVRCVRD